MCLLVICVPCVVVAVLFDVVVAVSSVFFSIDDGTDGAILTMMLMMLMMIWVMVMMLMTMLL